MSDNEPDKVDLETPGLAAEKRAALAELFPGAIEDGVLDTANIAALLDLEVTAAPDGRERFGLRWAGKQEAVRSLLRPSKATLVPDVENSIEFDSAQNVFIEGDNLEVLKLLQKSYNDKVKLIYIDPPYNTGNDFVYKDDFQDGLRGYLEYTGQLDRDGLRKSTDVDTSGRKHSKWLSMMYPRLMLARNLLAFDGAIFVSIDDNEQANLKLLLDEVFGSENFVASVIWHKVHTLKNTARHFSEDHDYILVYARHADAWQPGLLPRTAEQDSRYTNPDNDPRGPWISGPIQARNFYGKGTYPIETPGGRVISGPPTGSYWRYSKEAFEGLDAENRIWWGEDGMNVPRVKRFLSEMADGRVPQTIWTHDEVGHNQEAKRELTSCVEFGSSGSVFDTPKPTRLIRRMLALATKPESGDIVLDFFAGSGSTADAVLRQNAEDGGNRRFIAVQLPESTGHDDFPLISDITRARIAAVANRFGPELGTGVGVREFRLGESHFLAPRHGESLFDLSETSLSDRDPDWFAVGTQVLLSEGVSLDAAISQYGSIIEAEGVAVVATTAIDEDLIDRALELGPRVLVFMEDGFAGRDSLKANAAANARSRGITLKTV